MTSKKVESLTGHVCTAMIAVQIGTMPPGCFFMSCAFAEGNTSSLALPRFPLFTSVDTMIYTQGRQNRNVTSLRGQCHYQTVLRVIRRSCWDHEATEEEDHQDSPPSTQESLYFFTSEFFSYLSLNNHFQEQGIWREHMQGDSIWSANTEKVTNFPPS